MMLRPGHSILEVYRQSDGAAVPARCTDFGLVEAFDANGELYQARKQIFVIENCSFKLEVDNELLEAVGADKADAFMLAEAAAFFEAAGYHL